MSATTERLKRAVLRYAAADRGYVQTAVRGVSLMRYAGQGGVVHELYTPVLWPRAAKRQAGRGPRAAQARALG